MLSGKKVGSSVGGGEGDGEPWCIWVGFGGSFPDVATGTARKLSSGSESDSKEDSEDDSDSDGSWGWIGFTGIVVVFESGFSSSESDSDDDDDDDEEDVEAARLFRFRWRFLAGAFATAGGIVEVDEQVRLLCNVNLE